MSFFINLFRKQRICNVCSQTFPSSQIETCIKCRKIQLGLKVCKNCAIFQKRQAIFVYISSAICSNCTSARRQSLSSSFSHPVELNSSFSSQDKEKSIPLKDISFSKFYEDKEPTMDLPSSTKVIPRKFKQDLKTLAKIQRLNPRDLFEFSQKIGKGGFSKVYKVLNKKNNKISAIKHIKVEKTAEKSTIINEIGIMQISQHPNIVECLSCYKFEK